MKSIKINLILLFLLATLHIQGESIHVENAGSLSALIGEQKRYDDRATTLWFPKWD